ncbi:MAG: hypothetical protein ACLFSZ_03060 [Puniceicoccaceae bacterium]
MRNALTVGALVLTQTILWGEGRMERTGSFPWKIDRTSARAVADGTVEALAERDYFKVFVFLTEEQIGEFNSLISQAKLDRIGKNLDPFALMTHPIGRRFSSAFIFDQGMVSIFGSETELADEFEGPPVFVELDETGEGEAVAEFELNSGTRLELFLHGDAEGWGLDHLRIGDFVWPLWRNDGASS